MPREMAPNLTGGGDSLGGMKAAVNIARYDSQKSLVAGLSTF